MKRSLRKKIEAAINQAYSPRIDGGDGHVTVIVSFPEGAFPDAPHWSPGPGFEVTAGAGGDYAWLRDNGDGTKTAVVSAVGPKEMPSLDGGRWEHPEVWTVTAPSGSEFMESCAMWDKPHRVTCLTREPRAAIYREPYAGHPSAAVHSHWEVFREAWGFTPTRMNWGEFPFADRRRFAVLYCNPASYRGASERDLLDVAMLLADEFGGVPKVYGYDSAAGSTKDPVGSAMTDPTLDQIVGARKIGK